MMLLLRAKEYKQYQDTHDFQRMKHCKGSLIHIDRLA